MNSSKRTSRHSPGIDDGDPSAGLASRVTVSETLSGSHTLQDRNTTQRSPRSSRNGSHMRREESGSRGRYDADDPWKMADTPERYAYGRREEQRRGGGPHDAREGDGWSGRGSYDVRNSSSSRHGADDPDRGHSAQPLQDTAGWTPARRHDDRAGGYDREGRSGQHSGQSRHENDWKDDRKEGPPREWRSDNGWDSRKHSSGSHAWDEPPREWSGSGEPSHREDRSWEPAPSWQTARRDGGSNSSQRNQHSHSNKSKNKGKGGKKNGNNNNANNNNTNRQKRNWRDDDSQLNKYVDHIEQPVWYSCNISIAGLDETRLHPRRAPHHRQESGVIVIRSLLLDLVPPLSPIILGAHTEAGPVHSVLRSDDDATTVLLAVAVVRATRTEIGVEKFVVMGVTPVRLPRVSVVEGAVGDEVHLPRAIAVAGRAALHRVQETVPEPSIDCRRCRPSGTSL